MLDLDHARIALDQHRSRTTPGWSASWQLHDNLAAYDADEALAVITRCG